MLEQQNIKLQVLFDRTKFNSSKSTGKSWCSNSKTSNYRCFLIELNSIVQKAQAKVNVQTAKHQITGAFFNQLNQEFEKHWQKWMFNQQNIKLQVLFEPIDFRSSKSIGKSECSTSKTSNYMCFLNNLNSIIQKNPSKSYVNDEKSLKNERFPLHFEVGISGNMGKKSEDLNPKP